MLLSYKWDGYGLGSLCGAIVRASLRDANKNQRPKATVGIRQIARIPTVTFG